MLPGCPPMRSAPSSRADIRWTRFVVKQSWCAGSAPVSAPSSSASEAGRRGNGGPHPAVLSSAWSAGFRRWNSVFAGSNRRSSRRLRRLRLTIARDAVAFVVETGTRLLDLLDDLLSIDEQVLFPLAERHLAAGDWAAVREMEDGPGW